MIGIRKTFESNKQSNTAVKYIVHSSSADPELGILFPSSGGNTFANQPNAAAKHNSYFHTLHAEMGTQEQRLGRGKAMMGS